MKTCLYHYIILRFCSKSTCLHSVVICFIFSSKVLLFLWLANILLKSKLGSKTWQPMASLHHNSHEAQHWLFYLQLCGINVYVQKFLLIWDLYICICMYISLSLSFSLSLFLSHTTTQSHDLSSWQVIRKKDNHTHTHKRTHVHTFTHTHKHTHTNTHTQTHTYIHTHTNLFINYLSIAVKLFSPGLLASAAKAKAELAGTKIKPGLSSWPAQSTQTFIGHCPFIVPLAWHTTYGPKIQSETAPVTSFPRFTSLIILWWQSKR